MSKSSRIQTSNKTEIWESGDIIEAFENTDLGQAVSADVDDITAVISENILEKLHEIYKLSGEITRNNTKNHFNTFQGLLRDFKDWDKKTINKFARKIRRNLSDIDNLLRSSIIGVCQIRFIWIAKTKGIGKRDCNRVLQAISLSRIIPTTENFLHWCCCRSAKEVYQYPYLFDNRKKISNHKIHENIKSIKNIICKAIHDEIYSRENASYIIQHAVKYVKGGLSLLDDKEEENEQMVEDEENENINEDTDIKNKSENFENKIESKEILTNNTKSNNIEIEDEHYVDETQKDVKVKKSKKINNLLPILTPNKNKKKNKNLISIKLPEYDSEPDELLTKRKIIKRKSQKLKKDTNKDKISSNQYSKKTTIKNKIENNISDNNFSNDDLKEINKNYKYNQEDNDEKQYWDNLKEDIEKNIEESDSSDNSELYLNANEDEDVDIDEDEHVDIDENENNDYDDEDDDDEDVYRDEDDNNEDDDDEDVDKDEDVDDEDVDKDEDDDDENDDDEDDDDEDVDRDSFWKTLQNEAEKQLGFGRLEEEKNKRKSKTSKSLNKISSRKSKSYRNDLEMSDDDNKGDGIDIDTDED